MLLNEDQAKAISEKLLSHTRAEDAVVSVTSEDYSHARFAANTFTTSGRRENTTASVTVWIDQRRASASTNELDEASLKSVVEQAEQLARISPVDREYVTSLGPQEYLPSRALVEATAAIPPTDRARAMNEAVTACEKEGVTGAGFHQARASASAQATRHGNFRFERETLVSFGMTSRTADGTGSGYFLRNHFDARRLDTARVVRESIQKALRSQRPQRLEAGPYTVVLEAQAAADLLSGLAFFFDARSAEEGRSAFSAPEGRTKVGERIFDERINVYTDPWHPDLPGSASAQGGLPARKFFLVRDGVLDTLVYSRFWAREKGKEPTPGPVNTILSSSEAPVSLEEMIRSTEKGLLVTRFWYIRSVDPRTRLITGLTRDGLWYIENGEVRHPVQNFRFNQSILQMLAPGNVEFIGVPERVGSSEAQGRGSSLLPPLKIRAFNFTSLSDAV